MMAQYLKIESIGSIGSIILAILEVQVNNNHLWGSLKSINYGLFGYSVEAVCSINIAYFMGSLDIQGKLYGLSILPTLWALWIFRGGCMLHFLGLQEVPPAMA